MLSGLLVSRGVKLDRIRVTFDDAEYSALLKLADRELRGVSDQARHIVRQELERLGLLALVLPPVTDDATAPLESAPAVRRQPHATERPEASQ